MKKEQCTWCLRAAEVLSDLVGVPIQGIAIDRWDKEYYSISQKKGLWFMPLMGRQHVSPMHIAILDSEKGFFALINQEDFDKLDSYEILFADYLENVIFEFGYYFGNIHYFFKRMEDDFGIKDSELVQDLLKVLHKHFLSKSLGGNLPVLYNNQWLATVCLHMSQERF